MSTPKTNNKRSFRFPTLKVQPSSIIDKSWQRLALAVLIGIILVVAMFFFFKIAREKGNPLLHNKSVIKKNKSFLQKKHLWQQNEDITEWRYRIDLTSINKQTLHMALQEIIEFYPSSANEEVESLFEQANLYIYTKQLNKARDLLFEGLKIKPNHLFAQYLLGRLAQASGQNSRAISLYEDALTAIRANHNSSSQTTTYLIERLIRSHLGQMYHLRGQYLHAITEYKQIRNIDRTLELPETRESIFLYLLAARSYQALGDHEATQRLYRIVLDAPTATTEQKQTAAKKLSRILLNQQKSQQASRLIDQARTLNPDDPQTILFQNRLRLLSKKESQYQLAFTELNDLIKTATSQQILSEAYTLLGKAYQQKQEFSRARDYYETALEFHSGNQEAYEALNALP